MSPQSRDRKIFSDTSNYIVRDVMATYCDGVLDLYEFAPGGGNDLWDVE